MKGISISVCEDECPSLAQLMGDTINFPPEVLHHLHIPSLFSCRRYGRSCQLQQGLPSSRRVLYQRPHLQRQIPDPAAVHRRQWSQQAGPRRQEPVSEHGDSPALQPALRLQVQERHEEGEALPERLLEHPPHLDGRSVSRELAAGELSNRPSLLGLSAGLPSTRVATMKVTPTAFCLLSDLLTPMVMTFWRKQS